MSAPPTPRSFASYEHAAAWIRATFGAWADGLSDDEHETVRYYTSQAYEPLNLALRRGWPLSV